MKKVLAHVEYVAPERDRKVSHMSVPCPVCRAAVGEKCISKTGKRAHHPPRRVMALRAERERAQ